MNQQINLFQPLFRKERKILSFSAIIQVCLIIVAAFTAISAYSMWQVRGLQHNLDRLSAQYQQRLAQLEGITREANTLQVNNTTQSEIQRLEQELNAERRILSLLDGKHLRHIKGFSSYFESFSRQIVNGMWITGFDVAQGGQSVQIRGSSIEPELVPQFLQGLSNERQLSGTQFSVLQMLREDMNYQWIDFVLSTGIIETQGIS